MRFLVRHIQARQGIAEQSYGGRPVGFSREEISVAITLEAVGPINQNELHGLLNAIIEIPLYGSGIAQVVQPPPISPPSRSRAQLTPQERAAPPPPAPASAAPTLDKLLEIE